ncbi:MAG TPA: Do family serine endopeptidase [Candidatus Cloacimonadota bacterium]|nr:Do family serine endopeptidase [Candidatus Cloacimonadota bacterium]
MNLWKRISIGMVFLTLVVFAHAQIGLNSVQGRSPVVQVVRNVSSAVVQIKVESTVTVRQNNPFLNDDFFRFFFPQQPQQQQRPVTSMGSGFIFQFNEGSREAFIMTNNHVVEGGDNMKITVTLADKKTYQATVVGLDPNTDVAVIKITVEEDEPITVAPLGDSTQLEIGDWAIAIGNPFGDIGLDRTVTLGVISALGRSNLNFGNNSPIYQDYIQTDAAINPGNSGGPLLNIEGQVIGVNAAITSTSGGSIGIGFAIPINLAKRVVDDLIESGAVSRAYMGITPQEITADLMEAFSLSEVSGVLVTSVEDDSPADSAGLEVGDVIIELGGERVPNVSKFRIAVAISRIGDTIPVRVIRNNETITLNVTLTAFPSENGGTEKPQTDLKTDHGISVEALDGNYARQNNITGDAGVVVRSVRADSPASVAGIQAGNIILRVGNTRVNSVEEFNNAITAAINNLSNSRRRTISLLVLDRNKRQTFYTLRFD